MAGHSGARRGELCGLRWSDIDLTTGRLKFGPQRTSVGYKIVEKGAKSEAGEGRVIVLDARTVSVLKAWRKRQLEERMAWGPAYRDAGYVFTREDGQAFHPDHVTKAFTRLAVKAGLPVTHLHSLRHYYAAALISTGADIARVSKAMGHASIKVTSDVYGHLFESGSREMNEGATALTVQHRRRSA